MGVEGEKSRRGRRVQTPWSEIALLYGSPPGNEPAWPDRFGRLLREWAVARPAGHIQTLSLFTGGGGLDIGFRDAGFRIHTMVEQDAACVATLMANAGPCGYFGEVDVRQEDVAHFNLPAGRKVDFIIGCPPCQTFSAASRRINGVNGTAERRGTLFEAYIRLLRELSPWAFFFENVPGITGAEDGQAWARILTAFQDADYRVFHRILDAADYGVPQHRERVFLVGVRGDIEYRFPAPTHGPDAPGGKPFYLPRHAVRGVELTPAERNSKPGTRYGHLLADIPPGLNYSFFTKRMGHPRPVFAWRSKFSDFLYKADPDRPVRTLKSDGGGCTGPFHWEGRHFAAGELKRLQTIPDEYLMGGGRGALMGQVGNAVPSHLARLFALSILAQVFGVQLPFQMRLLEPDRELGFRRRQLNLRKIYQRKAADAIAAMKQVQQEPVQAGRAYRARLTEKLGWELDERGPVAVQFVADEAGWRIHVARDRRRRPAFEIVVEATEGGGWPEGLPPVTLTGDELSREVYTGAWKGFEAELCRLGVRADLVQLCGYQGYTPAMRCSIEAEYVPPPKSGWNAVLGVVARKGVGEILGEEALAVAWGIRRQQVWTAARFLKGLGYEVRSHNTNARIPTGSLLIPYAFPTLNPKSVQLYKEL